MNWTTRDIPGLEGKSAVVTGANSGLGYHTSLALAGKGARIIMACRNLEKGEAARLEVLAIHPRADIRLWKLDLSSLASVHDFAEKYLESGDGPDLLINNAGLMAIPFQKTADGFEMQFGVNYLGHFALTALLWKGMRDKAGARIVNVSSIAHRFGRIRFEDIHWDQGYKKWGAYGMSKLANLLFTYELARKFSESASGVIAASSHPGYADTSLQSKGMLMAGSPGKANFYNMANKVFAQSGDMGALPSLYAATAPAVVQGSFYGPSGFLHMRGYPVEQQPDPKRVRADVARKLWSLSEDLTGIKFTVQ